ncbi:hypothetical protein DHD32_13285 [Arenibacter sp. TNZ]|uniref:hypothetical protein n=1 Tax=Arenibacter TaxID=178469 RepID=UPI000CD46147|nr:MULTISPECIES: hypothetical protein [Arenibacter]MCM4172461.1 hypothetical protein [Arenibacter sp. TNZ]
MDTSKFVISFIGGTVLGAFIIGLISGILPTDGITPIFIAILIFGCCIGLVFLIVESIFDNTKTLYDNIKSSKKISETFPSYKNALLFLLQDKSPSLVSNDSKLYSYMVPLKNHSKGFDYYELSSKRNGGVCFSIVTMIGFNTIVKTDSNVYFENQTTGVWANIIYTTSNTHFSKEEYIELKNEGDVHKDNAKSELIELIRNKPGYAGETSRVLTEYYYNFCYDNRDLKKSALELLTYRSSFYTSFAEVKEIKPKLIERIAHNLSDNIPSVLFILFYLENGYVQSQQIFIADNIDTIYSIMIAEHVQTAKNLGHVPIEKELTEEDFLMIENLLEEQMNY